MRKLSLSIASVVAAALLFALPAVSEAQHRHGDHDRSRGQFGQYSGQYGNRQWGQNQWRGGGFGWNSGYRGWNSGRTVVHPTHWHWTPYRGWHQHGHIHVPHRGHYHTVPY